MLTCPYSETCSGCDWLHLPAKEQTQLKIEHLRESLGANLGADQTIHVRSIAEGGLRDRVDLVFDRRDGERRLGLFGRHKKGVVDLDRCPQLSSALEAWLRDFRAFDFPIERGSLRLRVAPDGRRGVWLDFANVDVKTLLDEQTLLQQLLDEAIVEIGQRHKRLVIKEDRLKLADPVLYPWFQTHLRKGPVPLYCTLGSFTQPGLQANEALVQEVMKLAYASGARHALEFGAGIGNFTLPLGEICERVDAFELNALATDGLKRSAAEAHLPEGRIQVHVGDFQRLKSEPPDFSGADLVIVDPPRSGLLKFLDPIIGMERPPTFFIYVSCYAESFSQDLARLTACGYKLTQITIVDQFPQSRHYEIVAALTYGN